MKIMSHRVTMIMLLQRKTQPHPSSSKQPLLNPRPKHSQLHRRNLSPPLPKRRTYSAPTTMTMMIARRSITRSKDQEPPPASQRQLQLLQHKRNLHSRRKRRCGNLAMKTTTEAALAPETCESSSGKYGPSYLPSLQQI